MKKALITGITGQDGSLLAKFLISIGYQVHGLIRRASAPNNHRIIKLLSEEIGSGDLHLHFGDLTDFVSIVRIVQEVKPSEIYNLAAQSHVAVSFEVPEYTANADGIGCLRILEAVKLCGLINHTKFYQASISELYEKVQETPQKETTAFHPRSPYAVAKLYSYWITVNYRESYGMHASNGILFNHEGELRGEMFVTRKITKAVAKIANGSYEVIKLGNLDAQRDWGDAAEYVQGMYKIVQNDKPDDFVLATGVMHSVREFTTHAFRSIGKDIAWEGSGADEFGYCRETKLRLVEVDKKFFRPAEVDLLLGDPTKAEKKLGWKHLKPFSTLVEDMVKADIQRQFLIKKSGVTLEDFI